MRFDPPLRRGRLIRRYKRFFADVELDGVGEVVAHCPNTGALRGCLVEGAPVLVAPATTPGRRLAWTWTAVHVDDTWVGVHSALAERLVREAIGGPLLPELGSPASIATQVKVGASRIDMVLTCADARPIFVEIKSTTMRLHPGVAAFPDAVTERGLRHLGELRALRRRRQRAALVLVIQRDDCQRFAPADAIDPAWGAELRRAIGDGVEVYALATRIDADVLEVSSRMALEV